MKVFLSGHVRTNWRDEIINTLPKVKFFNPRKQGWTRFDIYNEIAEIYRCDVIAVLLDDTAGKGTFEEMKLAELFGKNVIYGDTPKDIINQLLNKLKSDAHA